MSRRRKILIVDDEPINIEFFNIMLSNLGFDVENAGDGEEALDRVKEINPDLIILDNIMPKLTGWEVTKILKQDGEYEDFRHIPIIMFSAMDDVKDKIEGYELGVDDYITKPFNFSEVLARIRAVLRSHELALQVVHKEKKIAHIESLNQSLVYFTEHLRNPMLELLQESKKLDSSSADTIKAFTDKVQTECEETLAALDSLKEEIAELEKSSRDESENANILVELEEKFKKNFANWKKNQESLNEVH